MSYALWLEEWAATPTPLDAKVLPAGLAAATTALQVDPRSSEAWLARAILIERQQPRAAAAARAAYQRAIALDPRSAEPHWRYGEMLMNLGDLGAAREQFRQALTAEPANARALTALAELSLRERQYVDACRLLNTAISVQPKDPDAYVLRALARLRFREFRFAWSDAELATRLGWSLPGEAVGTVVDLAAKDTARARARVKRLIKQPPAAGAAPLGVRDGRYLAIALTAVGERQRALSALERVAPRGVALWRALQDPHLDPLRSDPRFRKLLAASSPAGN
jgi:tetratricopeptide (TPR) repeat protein